MPSRSRSRKLSTKNRKNSSKTLKRNTRKTLKRNTRKSLKINTRKSLKRNTRKSKRSRRVNRRRNMRGGEEYSWDSEEDVRVLQRLLDGLAERRNAYSREGDKAAEADLQPEMTALQIKINEKMGKRWPGGAKSKRKQRVGVLNLHLKKRKRYSWENEGVHDLQITKQRLDDIHDQLEEEEDEGMPAGGAKELETEIKAIKEKIRSLGGDYDDAEQVMYKNDSRVTPLEQKLALLSRLEGQSQGIESFANQHREEELQPSGRSKFLARQQGDLKEDISVLKDEIAEIQQR